MSTGLFFDGEFFDGGFFDPLPGGVVGDPYEDRGPDAQLTQRERAREEENEIMAVIAAALPYIFRRRRRVR